eukprot:scaffold7537_cov229-Pinguiococcus_pyrenoidosus.AAC.2
MPFSGGCPATSHSKAGCRRSPEESDRLPTYLARHSYPGTSRAAHAAEAEPWSELTQSSGGYWTSHASLTKGAASGHCLVSEDRQSVREFVRTMAVGPVRSVSSEALRYRNVPRRRHLAEPALAVGAGHASVIEGGGWRAPFPRSQQPAWKAGGKACIFAIGVNRPPQLQALLPPAGPLGARVDRLGFRLARLPLARLFRL